MFFDYRAFWLAKDPRQADDYQDAYAVDPARGLAAIADGVSASLFAVRWADVLVRAAVDEPPDVTDPAAWEAWLERGREQWSRPIVADTLAWHQRLKLADGAFSTLLWLRLSADGATEAGDRHFRLAAQAIGDSCLLHVRQDRLCRAFPLARSGDFGPSPAALASSQRRQEPAPALQSLELDCRSGDLVILATDAVAAWLLARSEADDLPDWQACWRMSETAWRKWMVQLREEQQMRYDDATMVLLRVGDEPTAKRARRRRGG